MDQGLQDVVFEILKNKDKTSVAEIQMGLCIPYSTALKIMKELKNIGAVGKKYSGVYSSVNKRMVNGEKMTERDLEWFAYEINEKESAMLILASNQGEKRGALDLSAFEEQIKSLKEKGIFYDFEGEDVLLLNKSEIGYASRHKLRFREATKYYIIVPMINWLMDGGKSELIEPLTESIIFPESNNLNLKRMMNAVNSPFAKKQTAKEPPQALKRAALQTVMARIYGENNSEYLSHVERLKQETDKICGIPFLENYRAFLLDACKKLEGSVTEEEINEKILTESF